MLAKHDAEVREVRFLQKACALFCALIVVLMVLGWRSQRVDEQAHEAVRVWIEQKTAGAPVVVTSFQHKPGFKGKAVRVDYTVNGRRAGRRPRFFLIRRPMFSRWEVSYEMKESQYVHQRSA